jgi:Domain of unknown function (DUF4271)
MKHGEQIMSHQYSFGMFFLLLIASLIVIYLRAFEWKLFSKIVVATMNMKVTKQLEREDYTPTRKVSLLLLLLYFMVMSAFLYRFSQVFLIHFNNSNGVLYLLVVPAVLIMAHGTKLLANYFIGEITNESPTLYAFNFNLLLMLKATGLMLLPIMLLHEFSLINKTWLLYFGAAIVVYFFLARYWRILVITINRPQVAVFHIILYFCALELIPILFIKSFLFRY